MRILLTSIALLALLPLAASAAEKTQKLYRWVDVEGIVHYGDSIPAEYTDLERHVVNNHGITISIMRAKRTAEEIAEDKRQDELRLKRDLQRRQDQALLATYLTVDEILLHRDRRVELFQAQARVTELYLNNLKRRLVTLQDEASNYQPYSADPDAEMIDPDLASDIATTKDTVERHQANLERFHKDEQNIVARFDGDVDRFRRLKGLN
ncbi:MAG: DUF4124 domain-containing protein [Gammaproteobacteria bacterium]|nr:MAG: DUF4124 domain-containing protein [Gammaproteobacteria bacterium]